MPFFSSKKVPPVKPGIYAIRTELDAINWFRNRKKVFGCATQAEVLQKWSDRKASLPNKQDLKQDVKTSGLGPAVTYTPGPDNTPVPTGVNPLLTKALAKAMQIDPQDKKLSPHVVKEMWPTSMLLADFCQCIQLLVPGTRFSLGPLKGHERMAEKVADETTDGYDYELANLNDAYRALIVCRDQAVFKSCVQECKMVVTPEYGIGYHKPPKNKFDKPEIFLGYGDYTYFLNFREVPHTCELQIHQFGVIFGKTARKDWAFADIDTYSSLESQFMIPGGLGHKFYEDYRSDAANADQKEAAKKLSMRYYAICQGKTKATPADTKEFKSIAKSLRH